jgi:hypothetical protein
MQATPDVPYATYEWHLSVRQNGMDRERERPFLSLFQESQP